MKYWFRVHGHAAGRSTHGADFVVDDAAVYPTGPDPRGRRAWFRIARGFVYPTADHPDGASDEPWFEIVGSFVYPASGHPGGASTAPWFQARPAPT
ncbi:MAG TPA: hypothetical protein VEP49_16000 [Acidimicrobiia bacterium]|nr:hypothetical protein [Acidimicrobiia bacterium]